MEKPLKQRITDGDLLSELHFRTSLASGPGGQRTNKIESKVQLLFDIQASNHLTRDEKIFFFKKLYKKINQEGMMYLSAQERRSQLENKEIVIKKFHSLLLKTFEPVKKRKPTVPTPASIEERLSDKHETGDKKANRNWDSDPKNPDAF